MSLDALMDIHSLLLYSIKYLLTIGQHRTIFSTILNIKYDATYHLKHMTEISLICYHLSV